MVIQKRSEKMEYYVTRQNADGKWEVYDLDYDEVIAVYDSKEEARAHAEELNMDEEALIDEQEEDEGIAGSE